LEQEIVPLFYTRTSDGLPRGWLKMMKRAIATICPVYSTGRMVSEYMDRCYAPSIQRYETLMADNLVRANKLARWRHQMHRQWNAIRIDGVEARGADPMHVGSSLEVTARVSLGPLTPEDVEVQLFHGLVDNAGDIPQPATVRMAHNGQTTSGGMWLFQGTIPCRTSGQHGYAVRVLPRHPDLNHPFEPGLISWG